ncbi:hypothetical protein Cgig2_029955 [Carnegiea gigantea]|uniref:VAN3-binding protein-like auxin canalisation domain-containing protein n=1 Tax=Carnegiea gigantea TaxID=171969 RepID=A0A9Q1GZU9_9CARY|nr:hypothetical protein Cgig2_029955 [Carnegiea gigantea]
MGGLGKWFGHNHKDSSHSSSVKKKDRARAEQAHIHAALSIAGLATALAAVAAADNSSSSSKMSRAVASAGELLASHCIELAEQAGAEHDRVASAVRSAVDVRSPGDVMTLTAAAATALRAEAALRARLPKDGKRNASRSPYDKGLGEVQCFDPFQNDVEEQQFNCTGEILQHTKQDGKFVPRCTLAPKQQHASETADIIAVDNGSAVDPSPSSSNGHAFNTQQLAARAEPALVVGGRRRRSRTRPQSPHCIPLSRSRSPMLTSIPDGSFLTLLLDPSASEVRLFLGYVQHHLQEDSTQRLDTPLAQLWSLFTLPRCSKVLPITHVFYEIFAAEFAKLKGPTWTDFARGFDLWQLANASDLNGTDEGAESEDYDGEIESDKDGEDRLNKKKRTGNANKQLWLDCVLLTDQFVPERCTNELYRAGVMELE